MIGLRFIATTHAGAAVPRGAGASPA